MDLLTPCKNKAPKQVIIKYENTSGPFTTTSGRFRFEQPLDHVVGMRVNSIEVLSGAGTVTGSATLLLISKELGSLIGQNVFYGGVGVNVTDIVGRNISSVVGVGELVGLNVTSLAATNSRLERINQYMQFASHATIQSFDWSLEVPTGDVITFTQAYAIKFILEFTQGCQCNKNYGY